jgi:hypothetical protein
MNPEYLRYKVKRRKKPPTSQEVEEAISVIDTFHDMGILRDEVYIEHWETIKSALASRGVMKNE